MEKYKAKYNLHKICYSYFDIFVLKSIRNFYLHAVLGRTLLEQGGTQTAAGTRARAKATTAGTDAAAATAADATDQRSADMRTYRGQGVEEAVKHRGAQSQENGA